jgi:hypothetical protein
MALLATFNNVTDEAEACLEAREKEKGKRKKAKVESDGRE